MQWQIIWKVAHQIIVVIEVVERLPRPENLKVSLRYVLKHSTRRGSNIFQLFDTSETPNQFVANRRRWLENQGRDGALQENGQNEWRDLESTKVLGQKLRRAQPALNRRACFCKARRQLEEKKTLGLD